MKAKRLSILPDGTIKIWYDNEISFPTDFKSQVSDRKPKSTEGTGNYTQPLIDIISVAGLNSTEEEIRLISWDVTSYGSHTIEFRLQYEHPILVSQNRLPDMVDIQLYLDEFKDDSGRSLPKE